MAFSLETYKEVLPTSYIEQANQQIHLVDGRMKKKGKESFLNQETVLKNAYTEDLSLLVNHHVTCPQISALLTDLLMLACKIDQIGPFALQKTEKNKTFTCPFGDCYMSQFSIITLIDSRTSARLHFSTSTVHLIECHGFLRKESPDYPFALSTFFTVFSNAPPYPKLQEDDEWVDLITPEDKLLKYLGN